MARTTKRRVPLVAELPKRMERVRARAGRTFRRALKNALEALPMRTRRAVRDLTRRVEKTTAELDRRRKKAFKTVETRGRRLAGEIGERATAAGKTVVERLDIASRHDLERLNRRVAQLERRMVHRPRRGGKSPASVAA